MKSLVLGVLILGFGSASADPATVHPVEHKAGLNRVMDELSVRAGLSERTNGRRIEYMVRQIHDKYGYTARCNRSVMGGISDWDCLSGLQNFYSALADQKVPPNPPILGVSDLVIEGHGDWRADNVQSGELIIGIPFDADTQPKTQSVDLNHSDVARYILYHVQSPDRLAQRQLSAALGHKIEDDQRQMKFAIEVDPSIPPEKANRGLTMLEQTITALGPNSDLQGIEVVRLMSSNQEVGERNQKLMVGLDVNSSVATAADFLRSQEVLLQPASYNSVKADPTRLQKWIQLREFAAERQRLTELSANVSKSLGNASIYCGSTGQVPVASCLRGLEALNIALTMVPADKAGKRDVSEVNVNWSTVTTNNAELTTNEQGHRILDIEYNASPTDIAAAFSPWTE